MTDRSAAPRSQSSALVPKSQNLFNLVSHTKDISYTLIEAYKSKGADPFISKALDKSLVSVSQGVTSAQSSFALVDEIIMGDELQICREVKDSESLISDWNKLKITFDAVLEESRRVAKDGATTIGDFLETVMPYLLKTGDFDAEEAAEKLREKQEELREYRKTLDEGCRCANIFSRKLNDIAVRVLKFRDKWTAHTKDTIATLGDVFEQLHKGVMLASSGANEMSETLALVHRVTAVQNKGHNRTLSPKQLKVLTKDAMKSQKKSDSQVIKHTGKIQEKTDHLIMLWNLIHDDVGVIEQQIKIAENGKALEVFRDRVDKLGVQYVHLRGALNKYAEALASPTRTTGVKKNWFIALLSKI